MKISIAILVTVMSGFFSYMGFFYAFKKYEKDDEGGMISTEDFIPAIDDFFLLAIVFSIFNLIPWIFKKILPKRFHHFIDRSNAFLAGLIFLIPIIGTWEIVLKS